MKKNIKFYIAWIIIWSIWITSAISWPVAPAWEPENGLFMTYINKMLVNTWVTTTDGKIKKALDADTLGSWVVIVNWWNVWINNINPQAKLDIVWKLKTTWLQITNWASTGYILMSDANGNWSWQPNDYKLYVKALNEWNSSIWTNCFLMADTTIRCTWYNGHGQLGIWDFTSRNLIGTPPIKWVKKIISGSITNYALMENWTIYAWWYSGNWEMWYWWTTNISYPYPVSWISTATDLIVWRSVNSYSHACAILADKTVKCWWLNWNWYLWVGDVASRTSPVAISISNVVSMSATTLWNDWHTCAVISDWTVKCWWYNGYGQLWMWNATAWYYTPTTVPWLTNVRDVYVWDRSTCAVLKDDITLKCWWLNNYWQLWVWDAAVRYSPTTVTTWGLKIKSVYTSMNWYHSMWVLFDDWTIKSTWYNGYGQLWHWDATQRYSLIQIPWITNAIKLTNAWHWSYQTVCALLSDKTVKCWWYNGYGQLWVWNTANSYSPVSVLNLSNVIDINMNWYSNVQFPCALISDWTVKCWWYNTHWELGQWDFTGYYTIPVMVKNLNAE